MNENNKTIISKLKNKKFMMIFGLLILAIMAYFIFFKPAGSQAQTRYILSQAQKQTIIVSVSGSGQVSASNQVDIKPKASGDVAYIGVKAGQAVTAGTLIAQLDASDALKTVRDADMSVQSAQLALEKIKQPADQLSFLQAQNAVLQAQESKQNAADNLSRAYENGFNAVTSAFLDLPDIMAGLNNLLFSKTIQPNAWNIDYYADAVKQYDDKVINYRDDAYKAYNLARASYDQNFADYKATSRFSDNSVIENLITETYNTTKLIAEATKDASNLIQFYKDKLAEHNLPANSVADTSLSILGTYTGETNTYVGNLFSAKSAIEDDKQAIVDDQRLIDEKTQSLAKLQAGTDPLDLQSQELSLQQKQNALADARAKLADYYVRAPFDGVITNVNASKGDAASSGTAIVTEITMQRLAVISLNEVDAAKVKVGQQATMTFDAIDGLSIAGHVYQIDAVGTVTQGVVNYNVYIALDTQNDQIKPGMSVNASIILEVKTDVLAVPSSAVKTSNGVSYVQILDNASAGQTSSGQGVTSSLPPTQQSVQTGISSDTLTEITSGLNDGESVVTQTIVPSSASQTAQSSSASRSTTNSAAGGGIFRTFQTGR